MRVLSSKEDVKFLGNAEALVHIRDVHAQGLQNPQYGDHTKAKMRRLHAIFNDVSTFAMSRLVAFKTTEPVLLITSPNHFRRVKKDVLPFSLTPNRSTPTFKKRGSPSKISQSHNHPQTTLHQTRLPPRLLLLACAKRPNTSLL